MQQAMQEARAAQGPILLEIFVNSSSSLLQDPLFYSKQNMHTQGIWDEEWAAQLHFRLQTEVEQAMQDALRDTQNTIGKGHDSSHIF